MKKIRIITFQNAHNYGATLQTYALQRFLNDKNYEANDINYKDKEIGNQYKIFRVNKKNELSFAKSIVVGTRDFIPKNRDKFFANPDEEHIIEEMKKYLRPGLIKMIKMDIRMIKNKLRK